MLNELILIGRVGRKEVDYTKNEKKVVTISLPLFHSYNVEGKKTEWLECRAFGSRANVVEMAQKGVLVAVRGEVHNPIWEDAEGNKRSRTYMVIDSFRFLEKKRDNDNEKGTESNTEMEEIVALDDVKNGNVEDEVPTIDLDIDFNIDEMLKNL